VSVLQLGIVTCPAIDVFILTYILFMDIKERMNNCVSLHERVQSGDRVYILVPFLFVTNLLDKLALNPNVN